MKRADKSPHGQIQSWSRGLIQVVTSISILSAIVLFGGFAYGTYAAIGGAVGGSAGHPQTGRTGGISHSATGSNVTQTGTGTANGASPGGAKGTAQPSSPTGVSPSLVGKPLHLVALGDSLTHGFGDASGRGYVGDVSQMFRQQGSKVIQSNLGIDGLTSSGLLTEVKQPGVQNLLASANLVLISIGGNDLNNAAGLPNIQPKRIASAESQFSSNLTAILGDIRAVNKTAPIVLIGLYNPYGNVAATARQTDTIVAGWDLREDEIAALFPNVIVVRTFDLFQLHPDKFLYVDHFHPNQAGYQRIAERVWQDIQA